LEVDNKLYLPLNVFIEFKASADDVIHSFAIPELAVKLDAIPGRLNTLTVALTRPGIFYGQCSELCGSYHGFMPIVVNICNMEIFNNWINIYIKMFNIEDIFLFIMNGKVFKYIEKLFFSSVYSLPLDFQIMNVLWSQCAD